MTNQADRIQNAINHIKSSADIDPWAMEIAVEALEKELKNSTQEVKNSSDAQSVVICGACDNSESAELYLTNPPQIKCKRSGKLHFVTDRCDLPSVQPDIIACGDCKHYIPHDKRCGYWNHGVQPLMWCSQAERRWRE